MSDIQEKILELMDLFDDDEVTTANKIPRPQSSLDKEAFDDFNIRNPLADGGMLVQPSADGSRPGYNGKKGPKKKLLKDWPKNVQKLIKDFGVEKYNKLSSKQQYAVREDLYKVGEGSGRVLGDPITIDGKQYKKVIEGPDKGKYVIREGNNNPRQFVNKSEIRKTVKANTEKGKQNLKEMFAQINVLNQRTTANRSKWIKNWLNKNLNKYNVREFNNFQNDLLNDFNAEVEKNPNKYRTSRKNILLTKDGFPIYGDQKIGGEIYDGIFFTRAEGDRNQLLSYQKIFFKNKLKDKDFKAKVNSYLDWNLTKKVEGGAGSMTKTAALDYGKFKKGFDDDVIYFMGEVLNNKALNPGGEQIGINEIFKKSIGKKADAYFKKYQGSWTRWLNNFYEVSSLAGLDKSQADALLQKQINDSKKIMSLFNVEKLPPEFVVAQDHLFGLSEAKALGDPKIARQTLQALVATTKQQNRILGQEGFSGKRTALIKRFKNASLENKANIVNQLNTLAEEYVPGRLQYNVKKDGSLKITNLQPEKTLKARKEAYKKITETFPKKIQNLSDGPRLGALDVPSMFKRLSPATRKLVGGFGGVVVPEVLFYQLDKRNRMSKGQSEKEAAAGALESGTLGLYNNKAYMEELKKTSKSMGIDSDSFDSAYQLNLLVDRYNQSSATYEKNYEQLLEMGDEKRAEDLKKNFDRYTKNIQDRYSLLANNISDNVMNTVGASPLIMKEGRENITQKQFDKPFFDMQDVALEKLKREAQSVYPIRSRKVNPAEGSEGTRFYNMLDFIGQGFKNIALGRANPNLMDLSERQKQERLLKDMTGQELYRYNKDFRDFTYENPITKADLENLLYEQPGLFAGGGIAKIAGVDQGPPPESGPNSQGLSGLFKRVKNI